MAVCGYSLATRNPDTSTITVHRLVQQVARDGLSAQERRLWSERAVQAVAASGDNLEAIYDPPRIC